MYMAANVKMFYNPSWKFGKYSFMTYICLFLGLWEMRVPKCLYIFTAFVWVSPPVLHAFS